MHWTAGFRLCSIPDIVGPPPVMSIVGRKHPLRCMFDSVTQSYVAQQLATELPYIMVCIGGIVMAVALWRRAPSSSLYVLLACGVTLLSLVLHPFAWQIARRVFEGTALTARGINIAFAVFWSLERGLFASLMLLAVYSGRPR